MKDKNGTVIKGGDTIFHPQDAKGSYKIYESNGKLYFPDGTELTSAYQTKEYWEVIV